jgi:arginine N-succinyltransferase
MHFLVRSVEISDQSSLYNLARNETLLSLPPDADAITGLIQKSTESFSTETPLKDAQYVFVLENLENNEIIGESMVYATYGCPEHPYYYFNILERTYTDPDLKKSVTHQVLQMEADTEPFSMTGGLVLDRRYRGHPDKLGTVIALTRFMYMGMFPSRFQERVISEVAEPLDETGREPFWEAVGKKLTGLTFEEYISCIRQKNMSFIEKLFPKSDIFCCLLSPELWPSKNRVRKDVGQFACHIIEKIGFEYLNKAHLNGGPIYGVRLSDISIVRNGSFYRTDICKDKQTNRSAFIGSMNNNRFAGGKFPCCVESEKVFLPEDVCHLLALRKEQPVFVCLV